MILNLRTIHEEHFVKQDLHLAPFTHGTSLILNLRTIHEEHFVKQDLHLAPFTHGTSLILNLRTIHEEHFVKQDLNLVSLIFVSYLTSFSGLFNAAPKKPNSCSAPPTADGGRNDSDSNIQTSPGVVDR